MKEKRPYRTAIIGAGRIGCGFDAPYAKRVLTHAHAITKNPRTELSAIVDVDRVRGKSEAAKWNTQFFSDIDEMFSAVRPDIAVIATPDETHANMLEHVIGKNLKLIILEKPIATNEKEARRLRNLRTKIPIIVNFRRRFDETAARVAREVKERKYGRIVSARGMYDRGIFHNGSHMLDLARMFFGEMRVAKPLFSLDDFPDGAAAVSGTASFEHCSEFFLMHGDGRQYSIFELDIVAEKKRLRFVDEGFKLETQDVVPDPVFAGFKTLGKACVEKTNLYQALPNLYAHAVAVLNDVEVPRSTLESALKTHEACEQFASILK